MGRRPVIRQAVLQVLLEAGEPMRFSQIKKAVEEKLGRKVDVKNISIALLRLMEEKLVEKILREGRTHYVVTKACIKASVKDTILNAINNLNPIICDDGQAVFVDIAPDDPLLHSCICDCGDAACVHAILALYKEFGPVIFFPSFLWGEVSDEKIGEWRRFVYSLATIASRTAEKVFEIHPSSIEALMLSVPAVETLLNIHIPESLRESVLEVFKYIFSVMLEAQIKTINKKISNDESRQHMKKIIELLSQTTVIKISLAGTPLSDLRTLVSIKSWEEAIKTKSYRARAIDTLAVNLLKTSIKRIKKGLPPPDEKLTPLENWTLREIYEKYPPAKYPQFWEELLKTIENKLNSQR